MKLRPGRDADSDTLIGLIAACWAEYPGCVMDLDENAHLRAPATHYAGLGGTLTVAEDEEGRVVGCVSTVPAADGDLELKGLYVDASHRGTGLAVALLRVVEREALQRHAPRLILWSDTRFTRAHRFYQRQGFVAAGAIRALNDLSRSIEYPFAKPMLPRAVEALDAAASSSAIPALATLAEDEAFWQAIAREVATGSTCMFAAWYGGALSGVLVLDLPQAASERHRADLRRLHVSANVRRIGLASELLAAAGRRVHQQGRTLLTATVSAGGTGERFLRASGFHQGGLIPGYTLGDDDAPIDAALLWRALGNAGG